MANIYNNTVKDARMQVVIDAIDQGVGAGKLKIYTTGLGTLLATFTLNDPCATTSAGVLTFSGLPKTVAAVATGVAAEATITDSADVVIDSGLTVGTSGTDIIVDNTSIASAQDVTWNTGTITHG